VFDLLEKFNGNWLDVKVGEISKELLEFVNACCQLEPAKRATLDQLLNLPFITKYNNVNSKTYVPSRLIDFLQNVFLPKRRERSQMKMSSPSAGKNSSMSLAAMGSSSMAPMALAIPQQVGTPPAKTPSPRPIKKHARTKSGTVLYAESVLMDPTSLLLGDK